MLLSFNIGATERRLCRLSPVWWWQSSSSVDDPSTPSLPLMFTSVAYLHPEPCLMLSQSLVPSQRQRHFTSHASAHIITLASPHLQWSLVAWCLVAGRGVTAVDTALATLSATAGNASALVLTAFQLGQQVALRCIAASDVGLETMTGWSITNAAGAYGTDYLLRARESHSRPLLAYQHACKTWSAQLYVGSSSQLCTQDKELYGSPCYSVEHIWGLFDGC